jgi:predicted transcriptional regulator
MLSPTSRAILISLYEEGDNVPSNLGEEVDRHRTTVSDYLREELKPRGWVECPNHPVYRLTREGIEWVEERYVVEKDPGRGDYQERVS